MTIGVGGEPSSKDNPAQGQFLSPDTLVPDAGLVLDDNRYMYARGNPVKYTDPTGHDPQCEVGTSACDAEWTLWRQYLPYSGELSWDSFVAAYRYYNNYASTPGMLLQDFLISNGDISGDQAAATQRLGYGEWYAQQVAGRPNLSSIFLGSYETLESAQLDYAASNNQSAVLSIALLMAAVFGGADAPSDPSHPGSSSIAPRWVRNKSSLASWAKQMQDNYEMHGTVPSSQEVDTLVDLASQYSVHIRADLEGHSWHQVWHVPHLNVGDKGFHVPVPPGYQLPK